MGPGRLVYGIERAHRDVTAIGRLRTGRNRVSQRVGSILAKDGRTLRAYRAGAAR